MAKFLKNFSYNTFSNDVIEFITTLNLENVVLLGHSMGSIIARNVAAELGKKIDRRIVALVLIGTTLGSKSVGESIEEQTKIMVFLLLIFFFF